MNRGFNHYFREGVKSSAGALYHNKGLVKFLVYFFMETIGRCLLIFNPLFDLAGVKQGEFIWRQKRVEVSQSFKHAGNPHAVWTYVLTLCVEALMFLAGMVLIGVFTFLLALLGYGISMLFEDPDTTLFMGIFSVPGGILMLVYCVIMPLIFAPTPYIVANNRGIGVGDTLSGCFNTMKSCGKWTLFLNSFIPALIQLLILWVIGTATYFLSGALIETSFYSLVMAIWYIVVIIGYVLVAPIFTLTARSANHHLFRDIVLDPVSADRFTKGINIKKCNGKLFTAEEAEEGLVSLFDETASDPYEAQSAAPAPAPEQKEQVNLADALEPLGKKAGKEQRRVPPAEAEPKAAESAPEQPAEPATEAVKEEIPVQTAEPAAEVPAIEPAPVEAPVSEPVKEETPAFKSAPAPEPVKTAESVETEAPVPESVQTAESARAEERKPLPEDFTAYEEEEEPFELETVSGILADEPKAEPAPYLHDEEVE